MNIEEMLSRIASGFKALGHFLEGDVPRLQKRYEEEQDIKKKEAMEREIKGMYRDVLRLLKIEELIKGEYIYDEREC